MALYFILIRSVGLVWYQPQVLELLKGYLKKKKKIQWKKFQLQTAKNTFYTKMRVLEAFKMSAIANPTSDPSKGTFFRDVPGRWFFLCESREAGIPQRQFSC